MEQIEVVKPIRGRLLSQMHLFVQAKPLQRPRVKSLGGTSMTYTPTENQAEMMSEMHRFQPLYLNIPLIVDHYFYFARPDSDEVFPIRNKFGDVDNLVKGVNDNLVKAEIIKDDRFIVGGESFKSFCSEPYTVILIWQACVSA